MNVNKWNKVILIPLLLGIFLIGFLNRDLFVFELDLRCERSFTSAEQTKGNYLLTDPIALRPARYELRFVGTAEGVGSGWYLLNAQDEIWMASDFEKDSLGTFSLDLSEKAASLRIGVRYDPEFSELHLERIILVSDHVLTKQSLLRHGILSLLTLFLSLALAWRMGISAKPITQKEVTFFFVLAVSLIDAVPLLNSGTYIHGEDTFFHLSRIEGIAESLKAGVFPARNQLFWLQNYGYGVGFFYPDLFLYLPALLRVCGFSLLGVNKFFLILCILFGNMTAFLAAEGISGKRSAGFAALFFQAFAAYPIINLYYRGTVGETQAQVFLPLIVWGLFEILTGKTRHWWIFALGFWGLLSCHLITLAMTGICVTAVLLFCLRKVLKDKAVFFALLKSVVFVLFLSAAFWLPMAEQTIRTSGLRINTYLSTQRTGGGPNLTMPISNLWMAFHAWDSAYQNLSVFPGLAFGLVFLLRGVAWIRKIKIPHVADGILVLSLFLLWACTDRFPWQYFSWFVNRIQFAWRFLLPASVLLSLCGGIVFSYVWAGHQRFEVCALVLLSVSCFFLSAFPILKEAWEHRSVPKELFVMQDNRISGSEYMPVNLSAEFVDKNKDTVLTESDEVKVTAHKRRGLSFRFRFESSGEASDEKKRFSLPLIYYYGYRASVTASDGLRSDWPVTKDEKGFVCVEDIPYAAAEVEVHYEKTPLQWLSEVLSMLTLLACIVWKYVDIRDKKGALG